MLPSREMPPKSSCCVFPPPALTKYTWMPNVMNSASIDTIGASRRDAVLFDRPIMNRAAAAMIRINSGSSSVNKLMEDSQPIRITGVPPVRTAQLPEHHHQNHHDPKHHRPRIALQVS